jgi:S1-C subfamily serine protease
MGEPLRTAGIGSGVLIDYDEGLVVTAAHVVQTSESIEIEFTTGEVIPAVVLASSQAADVALLKLERAPTGAAVARLGDSSGVAVGDQIFIVGAPLGISHTLTVGHISARRSAKSLFGGFSKAELLQTDAAVNHGNSGGPMFSMTGEVVGIVSSMISRSGGYEGLGFVIASNTARELLLDRRTPWTGFEGYLLAGDMARIFNLPEPVGILVQRVAAESPAARIGLRPGTVRAIVEDEPLLLGGDVILAVNGIKLSQPRGPETIRALMQQVEPGEVVAVTILRSGQTTELVSAPFPE